MVRSVIQLVVNGCHEFSYNTRMGIIRNILSSRCLYTRRATTGPSGPFFLWGRLNAGAGSTADI